MRATLKKYIPAKIRNRLASLRPSSSYAQTSYSQCGEDLLVSFLLDLMHGARPKRYLDVGANHPFHFSNTALLYAQGGSGILVEPDPHLAKLLRQRRPRDKVLQNGVHCSGKEIADFFLMDPPTLNTFSRHEMERCVSMGHQLVDTLQVELRDINSILEMSAAPDFMNLDIEGMDKSILEMIDWGKYRPTCVCVESLTYEARREPRKLNDIIDLMRSLNYLLYADTFINSIFVDCSQWRRHWDKH